MHPTALITGGTGGLGIAVMRRFLGGGWRVVVPWFVPEELGRVEQHPRLGLVEADLFDPASVARCTRAATSYRDEPLSAVINLVGGFAAGGRVHETPIEDFEAQLRLNLRPTYLVSQAAIPRLLASGGGRSSAFRAAPRSGRSAVRRATWWRRPPCLRSSMPWPPSMAARASASTRSCQASSTPPPTGLPSPVPAPPAGCGPMRSPRPCISSAALRLARSAGPTCRSTAAPDEPGQAGLAQKTPRPHSARTAGRSSQLSADRAVMKPVAGPWPAR